MRGFLARIRCALFFVLALGLAGPAQVAGDDVSDPAADRDARQTAGNDEATWDTPLIPPAAREQADRLIELLRTAIHGPDDEEPVEPAEPIPPDDAPTTPPTPREHAEWVVESLKTALYGPSEYDRIEAARQGRRIALNPDTLEITITDTPENLRRAYALAEALTSDEERFAVEHEMVPARTRPRSAAPPRPGMIPRRQVIRPQHQDAQRLAPLVQGGIDRRTGTTRRAMPSETTLSLRRGQEATVGQTRVRLLRVDQPDRRDRGNVTAQLQVIIGRQVNTLSLGRWHTQQISGWQFTLEQARASSRPGDGSVRVTVRPPR